jgi:hypothetical protein
MTILHRPAPTREATTSEIAAGGARRAGSSFDARYGKLIRTAGIGTVPFALFYYQAELGLQPQEVWFIAYVLAHRWTTDLPFPSLASMARHSGLTKRALRNYKDSLVAKGLLIIHERRRPDGGTTSHAYDFTPLFDRLDALIMRDMHIWSRRSPQLLSHTGLSDHPGDDAGDYAGGGPDGHTTPGGLQEASRPPGSVSLPAPEEQAFPVGRGTHVPRAGKRMLSGRRRSSFPPHGHARAPGIESEPREPDISESIRLDQAMDDYRSGTLGGESTADQAGLGNAERSSEEHRDALTVPNHTESGNATSEALDLGAPAGHSAALDLLIEELTQRFGDAPEHLAANRTRARRIWRESGLSADAFLALAREAERRTLDCAARIRKRSTVSINTANKMPYFFAVLANLVRSGMQEAPAAVETGASKVPAQAQHAGELWAAARAAIRRRVSAACYRAFFEPAQPVELVNDTLVLAAPDLFAREMLHRRFGELLESAVSEAAGRPRRVTVILPGEAPQGGLFPQQPSTDAEQPDGEE